MTASDDFSDGVLAPVWSIEGPAGTSANLATNATDAFLELVTPDGNHDVWGTNNSARAMQDISDGDFQLQTRFLSTPTQKFQLQGLLIEQDADNWIRFDTYSDGSKLRAFAAVTTNGSSNSELSVVIPGGSAPYVQVTRAGDLWTMEYSTDGATWVTAGSFTQSLTATSAGVFAGNVGQATGFTAQVDYFENTADPITQEDGSYVPENLAPDAVDDGLVTLEDAPLVIDVASDILGNDSDPNGDALSLGSFTQPANGVLTDNGDGTLSYTPNAGYNGVDTFAYTVTDGTLTDTATVSVTVNSTDPPPPASNAASDDFSDGVLAPVWSIEGPAGTSANLATNATDAFLELVTPDGNHDVWGTNNSARAMQDISDGDFQLQTRFLSTPTQKFQLQGLLIEQDADNWIRFDTYSDGSKLRAFAAVTTNGSSNSELSVVIPGGSAPYVQVTRAGDLWTMEYSTDGATWVTAGSFTQSLTATSAGVFAGNVGQATGFTAQVDYFENTADPITQEDGSYVPENLAPDAVDDGLVTLEDAPLVIDVASDILGNDSDPNGDALSLGSFTQPANGVLTDNGDGTLSYTPNAGYNGVDTFAYTVTDGTLTDTATVSVTVNSTDPPPPASNAASDDFSDGVLAPVWSIEGPAGTSANLATNATDAFLELVTPDGNHDVWGTNNSARAMQDISDGDFQLQTRFLSTPTQKFQLQGLLIEQDADNWIRFDTYSDGSKLRAFAAVTTNGSSNSELSVVIPGGSAPYVQVTRAGDLWTMEYSTDGATWVTAGSFTQSLTATSAGVFAGNVGQATGFTAQVDYFENTADPITQEDGSYVPENLAPDAVDDGLVTLEDAPLVIDVASDILGNDSDPNGDALSLGSFTQPANGVLTDNGDGTLSYTPNAGYNGVDTFAYTVTDGTLTDTATVSVTVNSTDPPPPASNAASDDFSDGVLAPVWSIEGPAGTSANLATNATDAFLELVTPDGNHDVWGTNNSARAMQDISDGDFQLQTRFLSTPTQKFQLQGLLIEQDADNWIRFDTYSDGSKLRAFAAVTTNGSSNSELSVVIPGGSAPYVQVTRAGDLWTMEYSTDGATWVTAGSFTQSLTATSAGVFAGNVGQATGFTAQVDYFENTADPITQEDGSYVPENLAPDAVDDGLVTLEDAPLVIDVASDILGNDSDPNGDALSLGSFTQPANGVLTDNGDGTLSYTPNAGYNGVDTFAYTVTDGTLTDTATVSVTVNSTDPPPPASNAASDDFSDGVLAPVWSIEGPAGTSANLATNATDAFLELVTPDGNHDVWGTNNSARAMQDISDGDFQLQTRFLSTPTQKFQLQGLLIEQDADNWIRFDTYSDGSKLRAFAAVTTNGSSNSELSVVIPGGSAPYVQVTRAGDLWTMEYSTDGATWVTAGSFTQSLTATSAGVFAGNVGQATGFTAQVDYFENTADPITQEDGSYVPKNLAPDAVDDGLVTLEDAPLVIDVASDILGNDSDPNGDALSLGSFTQPANGVLTDNGDGTLSYTPNAGYNGVDTFAYTVTDGTLTDTATIDINVGNPIDVWHGLTQSFGDPGEGQEWINLLGNVGGNVISLIYSLNGGPEQNLSLGSDTRRLQNPGDFNIDIAYAELDGSAADDVVTITATYAGGVTVTRDVVISYEAGNVWDPNYSVDWGAVTDLQDVVQVVDGTWTWDDAGVRPVDLGYDRLLVLGDQSWDNYELNLTITMHDLANEDPSGRDGGAFAIGMLWDGHTDEPVSNFQPKSGWEPGASFFYTHRLESHSYHSFSEMLGTQSFVLQEGLTYNFNVHVEQVGIYDRQYSLKVWEEGTAEPNDWTLQTVETFSLEEAPATGSIYLNAHYYDVTFGDLTVAEITGSDIIQGGDTSELLAAVDTGSADPGQGEIDVFVGAGGADVFVFGDLNGTYYDDGNRAESGEADYGFIWDFESGTDQIQLAGMAEDYELVVDAPGLTPGTTIWHLGENGDVDELVGVLNGVYGLDLNNGDFLYTDELLF